MNSYDGRTVLSLEEIPLHLGHTYAGEYVFRYVKECGCVQAVLEDSYIDKDYLMDYANYYARSFDEHRRWVQRVHFFKQGFNEDEFLVAVEDGKLSEVCGDYLGFSIVKPIKARNNHPLIGRTLLATYPSESDDKQIRRYYLENDYKPHLFGSEMRIRSLPFQSQDGQASACATVALWTASHALSPTFGTRIVAPSEITATATSIPPVTRCYPSKGLSFQQMVSYLRTVDLEADNIVVCPEEYVDAITWPEEVEKIIAGNVEDAKATIQAYIQARFPIIATLIMVKYDERSKIVNKGFHAVVISGFGEDQDGRLRELYVHDDGIGPYCRVSWNSSSPNVDYEWNDPKLRDKLLVDYDKIFLEALIVPVYPKFRLPSERILPRYASLKMLALSQGMNCRLMFFQASDYKADLIKNRLGNRRGILLRNLPRFVAVMRLFDRGVVVADYVYDATATTPKNPTELRFVDRDSVI